MMTRNCWRRATITGVVAALVVPQVRAMQPVSGASPELPDVPVVSLIFKGGTLEQFVNAIREASPDGVNIVLDQDAAELPVPAITLKSAGVGAALRSVSLLHTTQPLGPLDMGMPVQAEEIRPRSPGEAPIYVVHRMQATTTLPLMATEGDRRLRVASIQEIVSPPAGWGAGAPRVPVERVLSAIDTVLGLRSDPAGAVAEMKYHADTGLLVYEGNIGQIEAIEEVLKRVRDDVMQQRAQWRDADVRARGDEFQREEARVRATLAAQRLDNAKAVLTDTEARQQAGVASSAEVAQARQHLAEAIAEFQLAEARQRSLPKPAALDDGTLTVYDVRDFGAFAAEVARLLSEVGSGQVSAAEDAGIVTLRASPEQHRTVQALLTTLRRVKANDPRLEPKPTWQAPEDPK